MTIEIEIDGKKLEVEQGSMIIEAADAAGIPIPRFCYHKKLSIAANCRMCLVEVEKVGKPLPACATPVTPGMKVMTRSPKAVDSQKAVMEFLLINHPLDCPICDQGDECELQDLSLGYGEDLSRYTEGKRSVEDEDIGPLVATHMTRCIHCTRCVRFGREIAGIRELGATDRGEDMKIGTFVKHSMVSEVSGNIIDLCPVGALTSKPFEYKARAWELQQSASVAAHDCLGSNIYIHSRRNEVMRVVPKENEAINETWLSDRDRYSYTGLYTEERLKTPLIKRQGSWQEVDWQTALNFAIESLRPIIEQSGGKQIGGLISPSATTEEHYLFQKLLRGIGCNNIDHRLRQVDFSDQNHLPSFPGFNFTISELEQQDTILLIGSNIRKEQPLASLRVRKANLQGANVLCINPIDYDFNFTVTVREIVGPQAMVQTLAGVVKSLLAKTNDAAAQLNGLENLIKDVQPTATEQAIAEQLVNGKAKTILLGAVALNHPAAATLRALAQACAQLCHAKLGYLTEGANAAGAWLAGAVPHRTAANTAVKEYGLDANRMFAECLRAYVLHNVEPQLDCANPALVTHALQQAEFVMALTPFKSPELLQFAHVLLPVAPFTETSGTFVNVEGLWQSFTAANTAQGEARPAWKVLRVLGNLLNLAGFEYVSSEEIKDELKALVDSMTIPANAVWTCPKNLPAASAQLTRITEWPIYGGDNLVRRAVPLQQAAANEQAAIFCHQQLADQLQLTAGMLATAIQGKVSAQLPVVIDNRVPHNCVYIPGGTVATAGLGASFGAIEIRK